MKKIQLSIFFVAMYFASLAQFDSTKYVLGGEASYYHNNNTNSQEYTDKSSSSFFHISPSVARPIKSNGLIGVQLGFGAGSSKNESDNFESKGTNQHYSLGVFYQRFYTITKKVYFNWKAGAQVGVNKSVSEYSVGESFESRTTEHTTSYDLLVTPGVSWKVMNRLLLNGSIGGASFDFIDRSSGGATSFSIFFNRPQFGFSLLLN
ncbi:MAG: hypothetical protein RIE59_19305 [Imperialibacter sp.]